LWQRQKDVLSALTEAERKISAGEDFQNPLYDATLGLKRNYISVSTILRGCEEVLKIITPNFKEKRTEKVTDAKTGKEKEKTTNTTGIDTKKYQLYTGALASAQNDINTAKALGLGSPVSNYFLQKAYGTLKQIQYCLRQDVNDLGYDFKATDNVYDAWSG
jgi:hypothetical protein